MDAAPNPAHPHPTRRDAGGTPQTARPCRVVSRGFPDSRRRSSNRRRFGSHARRFAPNRTNSCRFGPNRIVSAEYRRVSAGKRKSAGKGKKKNLLDWTGYCYATVGSGLICFFMFFFASSSELFSVFFFFFSLEVFCNVTTISLFDKYKNFPLFFVPL